MANTNFLTTPTDLITTATNPLALVEGALKAYRETNTVPSYYNEVFDIRETDRAYEIMQMGIPAGPAKSKAEGAPTKAAYIGVAWNTQFQLKPFASKLPITSEMLKFNTIEKQWPQMEANLKKSMLLTRNLQASALLEKGFDTTSGAATFLGQPLFSPNHQLANGTAANTTPVGMALSTQSAALFQQLMTKNKDMAGNPDPLNPRALVVSPSQQRTAFRIIGSYHDPESANLGVNYSGPASLGSNFPVIVNVYGDDQSLYYFLSDLDTPGLVFFFYPGGTEIEYDNSPDTKVSTLYVYELMVPGVHDWRAVFGGRVPGGVD